MFDIAYKILRRYVEIGDLNASMFIYRQLWLKFDRLNEGLNISVVAPIKANSIDEDNLDGKPKAYTDKTIARALREGAGNISEAAIILECSRQRICNALGRSPMLREIVWDFEWRIYDIAYGNLVHYVEIDNWTAITFLLRLHP